MENLPDEDIDDEIKDSIDIFHTNLGVSSELASSVHYTTGLQAKFRVWKKVNISALHTEQ